MHQYGQAKSLFTGFQSAAANLASILSFLCSFVVQTDSKLEHATYHFYYYTNQ